MTKFPRNILKKLWYIWIAENRTEIDYSETETESEYQVFRKLMKRGGVRHLKRMKADVVDSGDSTDCDWLLKDVKGKRFKRSKFQLQ